MPAAEENTRVVTGSRSSTAHRFTPSFPVDPSISSWGRFRRQWREDYSVPRHAALGSSCGGQYTDGAPGILPGGESGSLP